MIYEFGPFEKPYYMAYVGPDLAPPDGGKDGSFRRAWCHPIGEGHPTAREAAEHLADLAVAQWGAALGEDVK